MTIDNTQYYQQRADEATRRSEAATRPAVRQAHLNFAAAYRGRAGELAANIGVSNGLGLEVERDTSVG